MGLHLCPIEPDDWTNGPNYEEGEECRECGGSGELIGDDDLERTCPRCGGCGFEEPPEPDYE